MSRARRGPAPASDSGRELELIWRGKYDRDGRRAAPGPRSIALETIEAHLPTVSPDAPTVGELVWGDNLDALDAWLPMHRGRVDLAYIDPPFSTGSEFSVLTRARGADGEPQIIAQPAYTDRWVGGAAAYLGMLAPRLERIHALLADHGSLYVHVDPTLGHAVRLLLDEVFGAASFQREIIWRIGWVSGFKTRARNWIRNHDTILFYAKDPKRMRFNKVYVPHPEGYVRRAGAAAKAPGMAVDDVWNAGSGDLALVGADALDSIQIKSFSREKTGYATQKNESLLRRIMAASSNAGDLVLDAFSGAGTTAVVAASMGRRFLAADVGEAAIHLTRARLRARVADAAWTLAVPRGSTRTAAATTVERITTRHWRIRSAPEGTAVALELRIGADARASIEVVDVRLDPRVRASLGAALAAGVDPIREVAIDWRARDAVLRPTELRGASTEDAPSVGARRFVSPTPLGPSTHAVVQLVDLGFTSTRIGLTIERGRTWRVTPWSPP